MLIFEVNTLISWIQMVVHNRQGKNSIYINLIQRLSQALRGEWRDPPPAFRYELSVWLEQRGKVIINRLCVLLLANSCWALRYAARLTMFKEAGRVAWGSEDVPGSRSTSDHPKELFNVQELVEGEKSLKEAFSWTWLTWGRGCRGGPGLRVEK